MSRFAPTHLLTLTRHNGTHEAQALMLDADSTGAGTAYTREEWNAGARADWEVDEKGTWTFQGQAVPSGFESVTVAALRKRGTA